MSFQFNLVHKSQGRFRVEQPVATSPAAILIEECKGGCLFIFFEFYLQIQFHIEVKMSSKLLINNLVSLISFHREIRFLSRMKSATS